ncbi:hypothetical protein IA69_21290 [Massilia sp. JS1662]|nr:DUF1496 domain-containing protein [Massilia sp. JS1662]KGF79958.1 hypothetical protein IA69_21290 [Massilia sp. JS1662]
MKSMFIMAAALAAVVVVPAKAADPSHCFYQDQKYSEGAALNGRVCTRGNATGKGGDLIWAPQEGSGLSGMQQEVERIRMQTQLVQARMLLAETEARYREVTAKSSGKN